MISLHYSPVKQSLMLVNACLLNLYEVFLLDGTTWILQHLVAYGELCVVDKVL